MESSSERCKIRNTSAYGHVIHVVSGGLLKVAGRDEKGRVTLEAPTMKELEESREGLPAYLDPDYPWDR